MSTAHASHQPEQAPQLLQLLAARLNVGAAVCFTEGLSASIMVAVPEEYWRNVTGTLLSFIGWLVFWCYRENKLGADVGDLCFYDFFINCIVLALYVNGVDPSALWIPIAAISVLKIIRVYLWANSATQQQAWGKFGPMTWYHAKYHTPAKPISSNKRLVIELIAALIVAAGVSVAIRFLPNAGRVAITWIVPFTFEFLRGPVQLRNLKIFGGLLSTKDEQITELTEKLALSEAKNELLREMGNLPDEECVALINAYRVLPKEKQIGLVQWAKLMAKNFGLPASDSNTK